MGSFFLLGSCLPLLLLLQFPSFCDCFVPVPIVVVCTTRRTKSSPSPSSSSSSISLVYDYEHDLNNPDMAEIWMAGAVRYENVPLPDSMMDTTLFVGNLCEFVQDGDLSEQFRSVTSLRSLPAVVARRPNSQSLKYGFVAFPTVEEKEAAIIRFHGVELMGRRLKVEEILDHPSKGRVNVPEKLVTYVLGAAKKTPRGKNDFSLRKTSNSSNRKIRSKRWARDANGGGKAASNHNGNGNGNGNGYGNHNKTQGGRKGDRKQKRANVKKKRRRERDRDFFF